MRIQRNYHNLDCILKLKTKFNAKPLKTGSNLLVNYENNKLISERKNFFFVSFDTSSHIMCTATVKGNFLLK